MPAKNKPISYSMSERKAKIIGTIGPSSWSEEILERLILSGLNVARINMSHGTHEVHAQTIDRIRKISKKIGREIAILADLQGPKIRVSKLKEPLELKAGERWFIGHESSKKKDKFIPTTYESIVSDSNGQGRILFDDGLIIAETVSKDDGFLEIEILSGGILKSNKGINLPDNEISAPSLTQKDEEDLYFALKQKADYIALSFVRSKKDIEKVQYLLHELKVQIPIISKIEKPEAVTNIDEIIDVSDMIMIARGDMGVEIGNHLVPSIQKMIIKKCNHLGVPVITATQMLDSMMINPTPTRAEASDVANAIWDGTDAVMLSGETASGDHPIEALEMMSQIVVEAEKTPGERPLLRHMDLSSVTAANQVAASLIAEKTKAKWIISLTEEGRSCLRMTRFRPKKSVLGVTPSLKALRRMSLYWGITPYFIDLESKNASDLEQEILSQLKKEKKLENGDKVVITHGDGHLFRNSTSNSIRVDIVQDIKKKQQVSIVSKEESSLAVK